jgi:predicted ArsR family transcriptional regulator
MILDDFDSRVAGIAALADPVRRALYRFVVAQPEPVSREQAAAGTGVARHGAKFHLDKLVEEGLLDFEFRRPPGRGGPGAGRPAKVYRRSAREVSVHVPERRYELAGQLLSRAITEAERDGAPIAPVLSRVSREAGRLLGDTASQRVKAGSTPEETRDEAIRVLERCGYEPRQGHEAIVLTNCPFHSLASDYTELACGMNLDFLQGFVSRLDAAGLEARLEPAAGRCCVVLTNTPSSTTLR